MSIPSFSQFLSLALEKSLNKATNDRFFLAEVVNMLGPLSKEDIKLGKPPRFSKKSTDASSAIVEICTQWMNYLNLCPNDSVDTLATSRNEVEFLLSEEITFGRIKELSNYQNFIVFYSSYYACYQFNHKTNKFDDSAYIELEEATNIALYGDSGDPLLNEFVNEIKQRLSFNLKYYDRFSKIPHLTKENITTIDKAKLLSEMRKISNLIASPELSINDQLLNKLKLLNPTQFEKFSLHLIANITKTQYDNVEEMITHNGRVGDGGVDGIVKIRYGISKYTYHYIQCKRYLDTGIGAPEVHKFSGAMDGYSAKEGIFITTSYFSKKAKEYVSGLKTKHIDLMDGKELVNHMLQQRIGIKQSPKFEIDHDFFKQFE